MCIRDRDKDQILLDFEVFVDGEAFEGGKGEKYPLTIGSGAFIPVSYTHLDVYKRQIEHKMLSGAIEKAQKKIENNNFGIRKNLLEYDQVMNEQREIIYGERRRVLDGESMRDSIYNMITEFVENTTCLLYTSRCV